ncbi:MAG: hypothetical protein PUE56_04335 [Clostridium sp.]|nr:hypothetical protein [Clostridium sp.]
MKDFIKALCKKFGITKETARRAARTFCQAAIGYISVNLIMVDFSCDKDVAKSAIIGLLVSAISAGVAAVMNLDKEGE